MNIIRLHAVHEMRPNVTVVEHSVVCVCVYTVSVCLSVSVLVSKKLFVDVRTGGRTFETHFIRSTRMSRPKDIIHQESLGTNIL